MSTRAVIKFIEVKSYGKPETVSAQIYQHHDGSPHVDGLPDNGLVLAILKGLQESAENENSCFLKVGQVASFVAKALIESGRFPEIETPAGFGDHQWDYEIRNADDGFELRFAKRYSGQQLCIGSEEYEGREWISHRITRKQTA